MDLTYVWHVGEYMHGHAHVVFLNAHERKTFVREKIYEVVVRVLFRKVLFDLFVNLMSRQFSLCQVAGANVKATVHFRSVFAGEKKTKRH